MLDAFDKFVKASTKGSENTAQIKMPPPIRTAACTGSVFAHRIQCILASYARHLLHHEMIQHAHLRQNRHVTLKQIMLLLQD